MRGSPQCWSRAWGYKLCGWWMGGGARGVPRPGCLRRNRNRKEWDGLRLVWNRDTCLLLRHVLYHHQRRTQTLHGLGRSGASAELGRREGVGLERVELGVVVLGPSPTCRFVDLWDGEELESASVLKLGQGNGDQQRLTHHYLLRDGHHQVVR